MLATVIYKERVQEHFFVKEERYGIKRILLHVLNNFLGEIQVDK